MAQESEIRNKIIELEKSIQIYLEGSRDRVKVNSFNEVVDLVVVSNICFSIYLLKWTIGDCENEDIAILSKEESDRYCK